VVIYAIKKINLQHVILDTFFCTCINFVNICCLIHLQMYLKICDAFKSLYANHMPGYINQPNIEFRKSILINC